MHGMPLAMVLQEDNLNSRINNPCAETLQYWEKIKNIGGNYPKILAQDIVFISVRDTEEPENDLITKNKIKNFTTEEVRMWGHGTNSC
jgi:arginase